VFTELGSGAIWVVIFLVVFYTAVIAVLVRHIGTVLKALLEERDPERQHVLREVLRDLRSFTVGSAGESGDGVTRSPATRPTAVLLL